MVNPLAVQLGTTTLQNPLIPASGCFGFGDEFLDFYDPNILGAVALKGTTRDARDGNATPRIAETPAGMINSIGLQNPGIDVVLSKKLPHLATFYSQPVILNISGFSIDDYVASCAAADGKAEIIELNVSCPNVHGGGISFGSSCPLLVEVVRAVREVVTQSQLFIKLSPNVTDIVEMARGAVDAGADGLTLINTLLGMRIDLKRRHPVIAAGAGGFSGPAIFPIAVRMIHAVKSAIDVPIMGSGGVASASDALEMMMAGATAVQVGAESLRDPMVIPRIIDELPALLDELEIDQIADVIGEALAS
ncbi:dihydroorotate dehydrogenase [Actinomycetaceae bacterium WB03_NA08]|uniref:Dihydroorotate dehydrogenase n=1 Tax=Scrofimicrobium canadense TaxID=2652290 RepID=A0A6N7VRN1_9ACTO|nr:dihydroorotate dehydrogenase [Scrofimicrobium canadense]MSS84427.1 dihydroorotate dehydrogenase [Scrofimicrobium canadense]